MLFRYLQSENKFRGQRTKAFEKAIDVRHAGANCLLCEEVADT